MFKKSLDPLSKNYLPLYPILNHGNLLKDLTCWDYLPS